ncbi:MULTISPECIES: DEAD/DEAH box helicase [Methylobacterium]|uniref:DEAD/DEAH box helicase n=1 Tax=Methylobacterium longum TaxID=767694 RepID=A0ABT8AUE3_9HYPH|nr:MULTISPECIES: DEAD/DEAH box helicase [Methylobacterium]MCJ2102922.1 DEAD/DEAH box helicase [Methylobacterium sp. E-046]MDN3573424.1 DEAD/DEAH box helicase [Methylobacterium longum]GJE12865.1 ATP-dependent RNA helicase DbpA [Methylobacterium longum]
MLRLRDYQRASLDALSAAWARGGADAAAPGHLIVLPTGAGKALVIAALARETLAENPLARVAIVTHSRELVAQNFSELTRAWPEAPAGIFSAGLGRREAGAQVLVCGIQSVADRLDAVGPRDLVIVDEAHLIPRAADTRYGRFLAGLRARTPGLRVAGFTATPYRLDSGRLDDGAHRLFSGIAYEADTFTLIRRGFLAPLVSKATLTQLDVSGVGRRGGDYIPGELEAAVNRDWITRAAVAELAEYGRSRRAWLAFCAGLAHADAVRDAVRAEGYACESVSGETPRRERDRIVAAFRAGQIRCLTSVGVLGTGFNVPEVDLVALLRPTRSTGLYVQQVGRALRCAPDKADALILDYAGLVRMHGPVDAVTVRSATQGLGGAGASRAKPCPGCGALIALNASTCEACWTEPEGDAEAPHEAAADDALAILSADPGSPDPGPDPEPAGPAPGAASPDAPWHPVTALTLEPAPDGLDLVLGWRDGATEAAWRVRLRPEGRGYEREKAVSWWRGLGGGRDAPMSTAGFLEGADALSRPAAIRIRPGRLSDQIACRTADGRTLGDVRRLSGHAA